MAPPELSDSLLGWATVIGGLGLALARGGWLAWKKFSNPAPAGQAVHWSSEPQPAPGNFFESALKDIRDNVRVLTKIAVDEKERRRLEEHDQQLRREWEREHERERDEAERREKRRDPEVIKRYERMKGRRGDVGGDDGDDDRRFPRRPRSR